QIAKFRGRPLKELKRAFILDASMRPTRHNVLTRLYSRPNLRGGWFEQRAPDVGPGGANTELVAALRERVTLIPDSRWPRHKQAQLSLSDFMGHFLVPFETPDDRDAERIIAILLTLASECARDPFLACCVYFMDADAAEPRERSVGEKGNI